jgi:predicted transcriptional regulator
MNEESSSGERNLHLVTKIVGRYVTHHSVGPDQLADLIASVHRSLSGLVKIAPPTELRTPAVPVRRSVQREYVVCLECGWKARTLRRHLNAQHGFSRPDYLQRWNLPTDHPITAPAYSELRSAMAKQIGFGRKRRKPEPGLPKQVVAPVRKRRSRMERSISAS